MERGDFPIPSTLSRGDCGAGMIMERYYKKSEGVKRLMRLEELFELFVSKPCIFDNCFKGMRIQSFMVWNCNAVSSIGHADMLASCHNLESNFTECPDRTFGGDISKEHFRREPLPDIRWNPWFPLLSSGDMFLWHL